MRYLVLLMALCCLLSPAFADASEETPSPSAALTAAAEQETPAYEAISSFVQAWSLYDLAGMEELCAPAWKAEQPSPELELFRLMMNGTPLRWQIIQEEADDECASFELLVQIDRHDGSEPAWYAFQATVRSSADGSHVNPDFLSGGRLLDSAEQPTGLTDEAPVHTPSPTDDDWWVSAGQPDMWAEHNARFAELMACWADRQAEELLTYVTPGWQPEGDNPWWELQRRFSVWSPMSYSIRQVTVQEDAKRVTYSVHIILHTVLGETASGDSDIVLYWQDGTWYADPETLPAVQQN